MTKNAMGENFENNDKKFRKKKSDEKFAKKIGGNNSEKIRTEKKIKNRPRKNSDEKTK